MEDSVLEKSIQLREATRGLVGYKEYFGGALEILVADKGSVVLAATAKAWVFSVDLETMEVGRWRSTSARRMMTRALWPILASFHGHPL
jgi:hypothetical protein